MKQVRRLMEAIAYRHFSLNMAEAELFQIAIERALAQSFGGEKVQLPPWPTWEDAQERRRRAEQLSDGMKRLRTAALTDE